MLANARRNQRIAFCVLIFGSGVAHAADIKVLSGIALRSALTERISQYQNTSGNKVAVEYGTIGAMSDRVENGDAADVAIIGRAQIEALVQRGKIASGTQMDVAKANIAVFVRAGAAKPDISTLDAFKRALIAADSVSYGGAAGGPVNIHLSAAFERIGLAREIQPKLRTTAGVDSLLAAVAKGEIQIGFAQTSEIVANSGVELVGLLPTEIQNTTLFTAAVVSSSAEREAGMDFIKFLSSANSAAIFKAKGLDPK